MGDAPQSDKPRVTLVLTGGEEQKRRWDEAADGTMAELVRTAVELYIDDDPTERVPAESGETADSEKLAEMHNDIRRMAQQLDDVQSRVQTLERREDDTGPKFDLKKAVFALLPEPPEGEAVEVSEGAYPPDFAATDDEIAAQIGATQGDVREVLNSLVETGQVRSVKGGPENRIYYWKRGI